MAIEKLAVSFRVDLVQKVLAVTREIRETKCVSIAVSAIMLT